MLNSDNVSKIARFAACYITYVQCLEHLGMDTVDGESKEGFGPLSFPPCPPLPPPPPAHDIPQP